MFAKLFIAFQVLVITSALTGHLYLLILLSAVGYSMVFGDYYYLKYLAKHNLPLSEEEKS